jgi:tripartite-type tricarboxylate transporter receptor subunit TctC
MAFSSHASNAALYPSLPFDVAKDFSSITVVAKAPVVILASLSAPAKTLGELIGYARAHPGAVKYASSGIGTPVHLGGEWLAQLTGTRLTHVPYKGIAPAMTAMLAGETDITFAAVLSGLQHIKSGRLRVLAVAGAQRYPGLPEVPTTAEAGVPGFEMDYWYALLGPAGMPRPLVLQIQRDVASIVNAPDTRESLLAQGSIAVGSTPEELDSLIRREYGQWSRVVKAGGVKPE